MAGFSYIPERAASSLEKMLGLLDVFTPAAPAWSTEDLIRFSGTSRSTCYRYIKALQEAGLLTPVAGGAWMLGPRIIELDRTMRRCDPVMLGGGPPMRRLAQETGVSALLCVLFSGTVMCVDDVPAAGAPAGLFSRGQRRPLFAGAASKVILAHLPPHQLRALFARHRTTHRGGRPRRRLGGVPRRAAGDPRGRALRYRRRVPARHSRHRGAPVQCRGRRARQPRHRHRGEPGEAEAA